MIKNSKDIILYICKYLKLSDMFNYRLSCKYINRIIAQYLYNNKQFYIKNESIYDFANCNIRHVRITEIFYDTQHKFYNLISLCFNANYNQDISRLAGFFSNLTNLHFGLWFNQDISRVAGSFPNLTNLRLGDSFNKDISSLSGYYPNLINLHLGYKFDEDISSLEGSFTNLTNLYLGHDFNQDRSCLA
jgi:outer membrane receptor protein involved in Fe transport